MIDPDNPSCFALFGLEPRFTIDLDALRAAYRRVLAQVHPDRFASASPAEQRLAMQWATRANEAHRVLISPRCRAAHLCELRGVRVHADASLPPDFLMRQIEWCDALAAARCAPTRDPLVALGREIEEQRGALLAQLAEAIDARGDLASAAGLVRQLVFVERLSEDIDAAKPH